MAEFLVRVVSKANLVDVYTDVKLTKRGDVIMVVPDGYSWASMELTFPEWRIFRWPAVSVSEGGALLTPELPVESQLLEFAADPMLQRRGFMLNLDDPKLPLALRTFLAEDTRAAPWFDVPNNFGMAQMKIARPRRPDPAAFL